MSQYLPRHRLTKNLKARLMKVRFWEQIVTLSMKERRKKQREANCKFYDIKGSKVRIT